MGLALRSTRMRSSLSSGVLGNRTMLMVTESALTGKRFRRVRKDLEYALSRKSLPGALWLIVIGHVTFSSLVNGDSKCLLYTC